MKEEHPDPVVTHEDGSISVAENVDGLVVEWRLCESKPGADDWSAISLCVSRVDEMTPLLPGDVRAVPVSVTLKRATVRVRSSIPKSPFASPSDPPATWRKDGRGRGGARTDHDYADLAFAYVSAGSNPVTRRALPNRWEERFGVSAKTWRNRLTEARNRGLLDSNDRLTGKAEDILFGAHLKHESQLMEAERIVAQQWKPGEIDRLKASGRTIAEYIAAANAVVAAWYRDTPAQAEE